MRNIRILLACTLISGALLTGCSGTDSEVEGTETESNVNSSNEGEPLNQTPASAYGQEEDTIDNLASSNIGGTEMVPSNSIVQNIESNPDLSTFIGAVRQAGLIKALSGTGPYTIFVPSNEAFKALPGDAIDDLMKPENKQQLVDLVNNHIVAGKLNAKALQSGSSIKTAGNGQVKVSGNTDEVMINGAKLESADIMSSNGVIHVINKVLITENK